MFSVCKQRACSVPDIPLLSPTFPWTEVVGDNSNIAHSISNSTHSYGHCIFIEPPYADPHVRWCGEGHRDGDPTRFTRTFEAGFLFRPNARKDNKIRIALGRGNKISRARTLISGIIGASVANFQLITVEFVDTQNLEVLFRAKIVLGRVQVEH